MPELGVELRESADNVTVGVVYHIDNVEVLTTEVQQYRGVRVSLVDAKKNPGSVMCWQRGVTSPRSKLGAFIALLGTNTDKWFGQKIIFKDWRQGARLVELAK